MKVGIFIHPNINSPRDIIDSIIGFILDHDNDVTVPDTTNRGVFANITDIIFCSVDEISNKVDVVFSIGGDGTFLKASRVMAGTGKPVIGIHLGGLGFLADISPHNYRDRVTAFFNKEYTVKQRGIIGAKVKFKDHADSYFALNDFVIDKGHIVKMIKIKIFVDNEYLNTYRSDGLIISTPTGSTAYSLSAGGPIVFPELNVISICPICPHTLSARPVVISGNQTVSIDCSEFNSDVSLDVDGQNRIPLADAQFVEIHRADFTLPIIKFDGDSFFQTLRTKMNWGRDIRGN